MARNGHESSSENLARLGGFEILDKLGEGGMGAVYRARQTSLDRVVALKVLSPRLTGDAKYLESFLHEARAAARLQHSNIVAVFDAGKADDLYYYAMELVPGRTLHEWVQRDGALSEAAALDIGLGVARALKHAWDKERLIHRDVKPENILIDADGNVKLCDLGLAKSIGESTALTLSGQVFGTPNYMSPEQARAERTVDCRSDMYSLGMTLYFAVTGALPFQGGTPALVMARRLTENLPDPRTLGAATSEHMCQVLEKMTAKEVVDRYQNWDDVLRDLTLVRAGQPPHCPPLALGKSSLARRPTTAPKSTTARPIIEAGIGAPVPVAKVIESRRRSVPVKTVAAILVVLVAGIGLWQLAPAFRQRKPAEAETPAVSAVAAVTVQPNEAARRLEEARKFAVENPDDVALLQEQLQQLVADFPGSAEAEQAQKLLDAANEKRRQTEAEAQRLQEELEAARAAEDVRRTAETQRKAEQRKRDEEIRARIRADQAALLEAESSFGNFSKSLLKAWAARNYSGAIERAREVKSYAKLSPLKKEVAEIEEAAVQVRNFWQRLPVLLMTLKGKPITAQGFTGTLTSSAGGDLAIEIKPNAIVGISMSRLTTAEVLELARAVRASENEDTLVTEAWFCFAERQPEQAARILARAGGGAKANDARRLMAMLLSPGAFECNAEKLLNQLRVAVDGQQWVEARETLRILQGYYRTTKTVHAATTELARLKAKIYASRGTLTDAAAISAGDVIRTLMGHSAGVNAVAVSSDGRLALSASKDKTLRLWDLISGMSVRIFEGHEGFVSGVALSPDNRHAVSVSPDGSVRIWEVGTGRQLKKLKGHSGWVRAVAVSPLGHCAVTGGEDRVLRLWSLATGNQVRVFHRHEYGVMSAAFSPDGRFVLSASEDRSLKLWEVNTGKEARKFPGHTNVVAAVAFSPDGEQALSGSYDKTVKLWDMASGRVLLSLEGHTGLVSGVAFSPDGRYALSASEDSTLRLWELSSGQTLRVLRGHNGPARSPVFTPNGLYALSCGEDKTVRLWKLWDESAAPSAASK
jgi:WD40 repeat protein